jgi:hypothetical protein
LSFFGHYQSLQVLQTLSFQDCSKNNISSRVFLPFPWEHSHHDATWLKAIAPLGIQFRETSFTPPGLGLYLAGRLSDGQLYEQTQDMIKTMVAIASEHIQEK